MEFTWTKRAFSLSIGSLFITFVANVLSNGATVNAITFDSMYLFWAAIISLAIVIVGFFMDVSMYVIDVMKWRNFYFSCDPIKEKPYICEVITNKDKQQKRFYCVFRSIKYNNILDKNLKQSITEHDAKISWSGGRTPGGIKTIDGENDGTLNIVSITDNKLTFEMASGPISLDCRHGVYSIEIQINRQISEKLWRKKNTIVSFEYFSENEQNKFRLMN